MGPHWLQWQWSKKVHSWHSAPKEFLPILLVCAVWGSEWSGKLIHCHCDKMSFFRSRAFSCNRGGGAPAREGEYSSGRSITKQPFLFSTGNSRGQQSSSTNPKSTADAIGGGTTELDITSLDRVVCHLYQAGLAQSTHKVYASGKKWYLECCRKLKPSPLPATEGCL